MQTAYLNKSLPLEVRYLAIIQLKNGIDKYWRKTAVNAITAEEKVYIRSHLLKGGVAEEEKNLALQNAILVSKVVRIDYPSEWPEALPNLVKILRESRQTNQLHLKRGLLILLQIVKEQASARLRSARVKFTLLTQELVFLLSEIYSEYVTRWSSSIQGPTQNVEESMECSLLALKSLRRLLVLGYEYPNRSTDVQRFWEYSHIQFGKFFEITTTQLPQVMSPSKMMVEDHIMQLSKLHLTMANEHPAGFSLLPGTLDLIKAYWTLVANFGSSYDSKNHDVSVKALQTDIVEIDKPVMERVCLKGLNIMRACIKMVFSPMKTFKYRSDEVKAEQMKATDLIRTQLLSDSLIQQIANLLVTKFFVLRKIDLEAWEEDQEDWEMKEEGGSGAWDFDIRLCSEKLFTDVVINYKHLLMDPLLSYFGSVGQANATTKDAIYTAMGLSAPVMYESFDFDSFLASTLVGDVQKVGSDFKILRRRVAILIGQWITIRVSDESRLIVYQIFQHLLKDDDEMNDRVVHITAARSMKCIVDSFGFKPEDFVHFAPGILGRIMALVKEVEAPETKIVILSTVRSITDRLENYVMPFSDQIVSMLASLWEASGQQYLLKQSIFSILSALVTSLACAADRYYPLIIPLIANSTSADSETRVYLLEEALDLWEKILETTSSNVSPDVLSLLDTVYPLLELGSNDLQTALHILDTYCILAPQHMLSDGHRLKTISCMTSLLGMPKRELAGLVTNIVENIIRAAEKFGGSQGVTLIAQDLHNSSYLLLVFSGLRDAWEAHQTFGPEKRYPKLDDIVETDYFTILARLAVAGSGIFFDLLSSLGSFEEVWSWLSTEWFYHIDCMANIERQKLSCLALTCMLDLSPPHLNVILAKLQDYFSMWTQTIGEMIGGSEDFSDCLVWKTDESCENVTTDTVRRRNWARDDIVHKVSLWEFVKEKLAHVVGVCGGETKFTEDWLVNVDEAILRSYRTLGMNCQEV